MKQILLCMLVCGLSFMLCWGGSDESLRINDVWEYKIIITNPGTKSEGRLGLLLYKGTDIGGYFETVIIGTYKFFYCISERPWDDAGYFQVGDFTASNTEIEQSIQPAELEKGWYSASYSDRKKNTPAHWVFVTRGDKNLFITPDKLSQLKSELKLQPLSLWKVE
ncbi:MAG: hypothetical protein JW822_00910 [Spirochaetales bacterium]|nr:hypothetical protein [Spirochaetales bacterium]